MNPSFLTRLLPAACAVVVASPIFAQAAPAPAPVSRVARSAPAQDPAPAPAARSESSADRVQTRLAEVMSMLEEEQMSAEMQQRALAKLTEVMERLKKERAAGQNRTPTPRPPSGVYGLGGVAAPVPAPTPDSAPTPQPPRRLKVEAQNTEPFTTRRVYVSDKAASAEEMGVPMPPQPAKAPKAPKPAKSPKAMAETTESPFGVEFHAKMQEQAAEAHEQAAKAHEEAMKVHEQALRAHDEAQKARVDATKAEHEAVLRRYRVEEQGAEGMKGEPGLRARYYGDEAAKADAKLQGERAVSPLPQRSRAPVAARNQSESEGGDETEIRATIESMRSELREIRALLKQLGERRKVEAKDDDAPRAK